MDKPRIGDTFRAACPSCSAETPVLHVIRHVESRNKKYSLDVLCVSGVCYRASVGSFDPEKGTLHVTWLDYKRNERPGYVKTELIVETVHDSAWAERLSSPPALKGKTRERVAADVARLLQDREYGRKRDLETVLAERLPHYSAVNLSFTNVLRLAFPELSNLLKELRIGGKVRFGLHYGHHVFGQGRPARDTAERARATAWERLREHRVQPGPVRVTVLYYIPVESDVDIDHFFQAAFPAAYVRTPFHRVKLTCGYRDRKDRSANFRVDQAEFTLTARPHRMELRASLAEKGMAMSLVKAVLMGNVLAREVACSARHEHQLLKLDGRPLFPSTVLIHNQLPHSEALWRTEYTNIHRTFHSFPAYDPQAGVSTSQRVILSHSIVPAEFDEEQVSKHLERFQTIFLREYVASLAKDDVYVPPSILRSYAPRGEEIESLVAGLTNLYEERLKKSALERERADRELSSFLNKSNFWLSVIVLLFSIAAAAEAKWLNWAVVAVALAFVLYLFGRTVWWKGRRKDGGRQ